MLVWWKYDIIGSQIYGTRVLYAWNCSWEDRCFCLWSSAIGTYYWSSCCWFIQTESCDVGMVLLNWHILWTNLFWCRGTTKLITFWLEKYIHMPKKFKAYTYKKITSFWTHRFWILDLPLDFEFLKKYSYLLLFCIGKTNAGKEQYQGISRSSSRRCLRHCWDEKSYVYSFYMHSSFAKHASQHETGMSLSFTRCLQVENHILLSLDNQFGNP